MNSPRASNRRLALASVWNFTNFLSPLSSLNFKRVRKRARNYIGTKGREKKREKKNLPTKGQTLFIYTISRKPTWCILPTCTVERKWLVCEKVNYSVYGEKRIHMISGFRCCNSLGLQREETRALMHENRVTWEISRNAVPKDPGPGEKGTPSRPPCVVRATSRQRDGPLVYRTFVFHYVMGHCTAQSYRGGMEQCRWVSYNTPGGRAGRQTRARAASAVLSSFRNQRKRPQVELLMA